MIAISDIIIFFSGMGLLYVLQLTHRYFYGKRMIVSGLTQKEESHQPRRIVTELPPVAEKHFNAILAEINRHDEFENSHSSALKGRV